MKYILLQELADYVCSNSRCENCPLSKSEEEDCIVENMKHRDRSLAADVAYRLGMFLLDEAQNIEEVP